MSLQDEQEVPSFIRQIQPSNRAIPTAVANYAPPSHPDRWDSFAELAQALEDFKDASTPRMLRIARLVSDMPVHEALQMVHDVLETLPTLPVDEKPDIALMLRLNRWALNQKESVARECNDAK